MTEKPCGSFPHGFSRSKQVAFLENVTSSQFYLLKRDIINKNRRFCYENV